jgi:hypothetical protein
MTTTDGRKETGNGRYYRSRNGSIRDELPAPRGARAAFQDPTLVIVMIANASDRNGYYRMRCNRWYRFPISAEVGRSTFDRKPLPAPNTLALDGVRDGLTVYRVIVPNAKHVSWVAAELDYFAGRRIEGVVETVFSKVVREEPPADTFLPPQDAKVELVGDHREALARDSRPCN